MGFSPGWAGLGLEQLLTNHPRKQYLALIFVTGSVFSKGGSTRRLCGLLVVFEQHNEAAMELHRAAGRRAVPSGQPGSAESRSREHASVTLRLVALMLHLLPLAV